MAKKISKVLASQRDYILRPFALANHSHEFYPPTVPDLAARDAITGDQRYEGSIVYVEADQTTYQLRGGSENVNWTTLVSAGGFSSHTQLADIGTNTHAQIDTHIADASIHFTMAAISITESQISDLQSYALASHNHTGVYLGINDAAAAADALSTTGANVDVSAAAAPVAGQVLTATSPTTATWQTPAAGAGGDILQIGTQSDTRVAYFTADKNLSGDDNFLWDDATNLLSVKGASPEIRIQDTNNPGTTMTAALSFWDSTGVAAQIRMDGTGDLRIENADGEIRFDTGTSDVVVSGNGDLSVGNNLSIVGYISTYGGAPADGSILKWITANGRAEFVTGSLVGTGTPVANQIAVFDSATSVAGSATFTWDGADFVAGDLTWDGSADQLLLGGGDLAVPGIEINGGATASPFVNLQQLGVFRAGFRFDDTGDRLEINSSANNIELRPGNVDTYTFTNTLATFAAALTVTGAFTSLGIDDNATVERLQLSNSALIYGGETGGFSFLNVSSAEPVFISGGTTTGLGGNITMYPETHVSAAGDIQFRSGTGTFFLWDEDAGALTISTGSGASKTTAFAIGNTQNGTIQGSFKVGDASTTSAALLTVGGANLTTGSAVIEIGVNRAGDGNAYIDFHGSASVDYSARIIRFPTVNGGLSILQTGTGEILLWSDSGQIRLGSNGATALTINNSQSAVFANVAQFFTSTASAASWRAPHGLAPTTPVNGDFWTTTAGAFIHINGTTVDLTSGGIGGTIADNQIAVGAATADEIEGTSALTFDGRKLLISATPDPIIEFNDTASTADLRRWYVGLDGAFVITAVSDDLLTERDVLQISKNASQHITSLAFNSNSIIFNGGGGSSTGVSMPGHSLLIVGANDSSQFTIHRPGNSGSLRISGGTSTLGSSIKMFGNTGSQAQDMYFEGSNGARWLEWDNSVGRLRVKTGTASSKPTAMDFESNQNIISYGAMQITEATSNSSILEDRAWIWTSDGLTGGTIRGGIWGTASSEIKIGTGASLTAAVTFDSSQDSTFAGNIISAAGNHVDSGLFAIKTADESVTSSTTLQDDDTLTLTLAANSTYYIEIHVHVESASTTPGFKYDIVEPDGTWVGWIRTSSSDTHVYQAASSGSFGVIATIPDYAIFEITAKTGGTGGTFKLQWAQNVSDATATIVKTGSWIKAVKLN